MATVVCHSTGRIKEAFHGTRATFDPGDVVITVPEIPRTFRDKWWDGATGLRDSTPSEQAEYDTAAQQERERIQFDEARMLKALAIWASQKFGIAPAVARGEILAIYRSL